MKERKINRRMLLILCIFFCLSGGRLRVFAAFPSDLAKKQLTADALAQDVSVYSDPDLTQKNMEVSGGRFTFTARDISHDGRALFGSYMIGGEEREGWVPSSVFLWDESFTHVYATVRDSMTIYSSPDLSDKKASIKKYSGIIALGKTDSAVQVVYETKKEYGIGWLSLEEYDNKLVYDGRDKQLLADGTYSFTTSDNIADTTVADGSSAGPVNNGSSLQYRLEYAGKQSYRILDPSNDRYMKIKKENIGEEAEDKKKPDWMDGGIMHVIKILLSPSYRKKVKAWDDKQEALAQEKAVLEEKIAAGEVYEDKEQGVRYAVGWTDREEEAGRFILRRQGQYFTISPEETGLLYGSGVNKDGDQVPELTVKKEEEDTPEEAEANYLWRIRAAASQVDPDNPMVFTQYDPEWCGKAYGSEGSMGTAGCGILATVNAVYALTGQYMNVMELADYAVETGLRIVGSGTDDGIFSAAADQFGGIYGFEYDGKSGSIDTLKKKLDQGDVAMAHVIGHYVAITSYDQKKDKYLLLDSNYLPKRETTPFGDWVSPSRLTDGYLYGQMYFFYKIRKD